MTGEVFIAGHSLGGARALLYAWARVRRGLPVTGVYAFAPPNPGEAKIGEDLAYAVARGMVAVSVKNHRDLVCDVPVDVEELDEEYVQPFAFTEISEPGSLLDPWFLLRDHHKELYQAGVRKLPAIGGAVTLQQAMAEVVQLYDTSEGWDWLNPVDGAWWALRKFTNGARLIIPRGSKTEKDWLDDFDALQIKVLGARVSAGFWRGIPLELLDEQLA